MTSQKPESDGEEIEGEEFEDLFRQAESLAARVEMMHDGPHKDKLRAALPELQSIVDELKPDAKKPD